MPLAVAVWVMVVQDTGHLIDFYIRLISMNIVRIES